MDDFEGPALPPGYVKPDDDSDSSEETPKPKIIGPQIPDFLSKKEDFSVSKVEVVGPQLPPSFRIEPQEDASEEDDDDKMIGPLPNQEPKNYVYKKRAEIEKRSEKMKDRLHNKDKPTEEAFEREEWMTVPDTSRRNQLGAICRSLAPEKASSSKEKHSHRHSHKDKRTTEELKKYNKSKRGESLLEMHKKSKKKKDKEKNKKEERKPFDREEMGMNLFSREQVNSVVDKAKFLNSRFAASKTQKFL